MKSLLFLLFGLSKIFCNDLYMEVSSLYLTSNRRGLEYAKIEESYETPDPRFQVGSRIGIGYSSSSEGWSIEALWTQYGGKAEGHLENQSNILPISTRAIGQEEQIFNVSSHWNLGLNFLDFISSRRFLEYDQLELSPYLGIRLADVDQTLLITHEMKNRHLEVMQKNHFRGGGLIGGIRPCWSFNEGFALFGRVGSALVYGKFWLEKLEEAKGIDLTFTDARLFVDSSIGLRYFAFEKVDEYQLTFSLSIDNYILVDQKRFWKRHDLIDQPIRGDLLIGGFSFSMIFEY